MRRVRPSSRPLLPSSGVGWQDGWWRHTRRTMRRAAQRLLQPLALSRRSSTPSSSSPLLMSAAAAVLALCSLWIGLANLTALIIAVRSLLEPTVHVCSGSSEQSWLRGWTLARRAGDEDASQRQWPSLSAASAALRAGGAAESVKQVVIVTSELEGAVLGGGIGTAYTALARRSAAAGHSVTALVVPWPNQFQREQWADVRRQYALHHGVQLHFLLIDDATVETSWQPDSEAEGGASQSAAVPAVGCSMACVHSWQIFHWLRGFLSSLPAAGGDVVLHVQDNGGLAYWTAVARRQGLLPRAVSLVVGSHGPHYWERLANGFPLLHLEHVEVDFMERAAVAEADWLISPSAYMLQWMLLQGWRLPQQAAVQVNMLSVAPVPPEQETAAAGIPLREIVFFGRLEARKGLLLFLDALLIFFAVASASSSSSSSSSSSPSVSARLSGLSLSFLGRDTRLPGGDWASDVIARRCASMQETLHLQFSCRLLSGLSHTAAVQHLRRDAASPPLAVIASPVDNSPFTVLECQAYALPFLAAAVGGIPELLRPADDAPLPDASHPALFLPSPRHLAEKLLLAFTRGIARPPVRSLEEAERSWQAWHLLVSARPPPPPVPVAAVVSAPVIDVCILYPDSLSKLRKLSRIILTQQQAGIAFRIRLVVVTVSPLPDALRMQASSPAQRSQSEVEAALADLLQPSWPALRLISLPFAASSSVVSYWHWVAAQLDGDFLLFLDRRDTLNSATAVATLLQVAETAQADLVSAMRYHVVTGTGLLHLGCGELLGVLGASSNCYSSRNLLLRRHTVFSSASQPGFQHDDDVWQWHMHCELRGLSFQLAPLLLFAADVVHIDAARTANGSSGDAELQSALSALTRWTDYSADGDDGPVAWGGLQQLYPVSAALRCPLLPVSLVSSALVAGHTVKEFQALARALRSSEEERERQQQLQQQQQQQQQQGVHDATQQ